MLKILVTLLTIFITFFSLAQRNKEGNYTTTSNDEILNTYVELTADISPGDQSITVNDNSMSGAAFAGNLNAGDLILIYQAQGGTVDVDDYATTQWGGNYTTQSSFLTNGQYFDFTEFGQVLSYDNAGNFEYAEVAGVSGTQVIQLNCGLSKAFSTGGNNKTQVIRVPRFEDLTVSSNTSITSSFWDGTTGGVFVLEVSGDLEVQLDGEITTDSTGFRGATPVNHPAGSVTPGSISDIHTRGFMGSNIIDEGSEKGEGIYGGLPEYNLLYSRYGYGAIASGGGGGGYHNAGGGGGSNVGTGTYYGYGVPGDGPSNQYHAAWNLEDPNMIYTPSGGGGRGGYTHCGANEDPLVNGPHESIWNGDFRRISGGVGGHPLTYDSDKAFLGGAGGAGHGNNNFGGYGGNGGGAVFLQVYGTISGSGKVSSNGGDGGFAEGGSPPWSGKTGDDGAGGAGAGGSIIIQNINPILTSIQLEAKGGRGGDQVLKRGPLNTTNQADGPGGGGAGGLISFSLGTPNLDVSGGVAGETNSDFLTDFPVNGATGGADGMVESTEHLDLIIANDTICPGDNLSLSATVLGNVASPTVNWYDAQYGGNIVNTGLTYSGTPTSTTTFYLGVCPGTFRTPVTIEVAPPIVINGTPPIINPETCAGSDGSITGLNATGGFGNLTFDWNGNASVSEDLNNATGGSYTLTITDEWSCSETVGPFIINSAPGPTIDVSNLLITDETCAGNDGSISGIMVSGGLAPYTFQWNGNTTPTVDLNNATNGNYSLEVIDGNGCSSTVGPFTVSNPSAPTIDVSNLLITDETCAGNDGSISGITVSGGLAPYTFKWNGNTTPTVDLNNVTNGSYTLEVIDGNGCSSTVGPFTISTSPSPTIDATNLLIDDETCLGSDGSITGITVSGGLAPYTYQWNGNTTPTVDLNNATSGSYTLEVIDGNGCSSTVGPFTISTSPSPTIDATNLLIDDETCLGSDGSITGITVSGGLAPYTYQWNGNTTPTIDLNNATSGSYTLEVIDGNGCSSTVGPFTISTSPSPTIDATNLLIDDESCVGSDGSITGITVSGGLAPYTYQWNGNTTPTADLNNATSGSYTLVVTDNNACSVTSGPHSIGQQSGPSFNDANIVITDENCGNANGEISGISVSGTGLTYLWLPSGQTTINATNLSNGTHTLVITDTNACTVSAGPYSVGNTPGVYLDASGVVITDANCADENGSITGIVASGGATPYSFEWNGNPSNSIDLNAVNSGSYELIVTDGNNCKDSVGAFTIGAPVIPDVHISSSVTFIDIGDSVLLQAHVTPNNASVAWSPATGLSCINCLNPVAQSEKSKWYYVTAISADGCIATDSIYIEVQEECGTVKLPTVFSPNGDGLNDEFCVLGKCIESMELQIYNRWGELIYESFSQDDCWDGKFRGQAVGVGSYIYKLNGKKIDGEYFSKSGNINLLK